MQILSEHFREKCACAYFFIMPALCYGTLSARLPGLKLAMNANDSQIGTILLALGLSTLAGLLVCGLIIEKAGARLLTATGSTLLACAMICASAANSWQLLTLGCAVAGLGVGLCDVGMNALGIELEKQRHILALSFLHGASSLGGVAGSLGGSLCAALNVSPFLNFLAILGGWLLLCPLAVRNVRTETTPVPRKRRLREHFPIFLLLCGILSLICHVVEGSAAEWGSLLLNTVKGAPQSEAGLTFACFTGGMLLCRFCADNLRKHVADWIILLAGSLLGTFGMILALLSPWPLLCLAAYAILGLGLAPVVPVLFSRAGSIPGISSGRASAAVSVFSYSGMLFFPPFLGYLAQRAGLEHALWVLVACCLVLVFSSPLLRKKED